MAYEQYISLRVSDPDLRSAKVSAEDEERMRKRHEAVLPKFEKKRGDKWCVHDALYKRASHLDHTLRQPEVNTEWRLLVNGIWRHASTYTHGTARALAGQMTQEGEVTTLKREISYKEAEEVLQSANTAIYLALLPVAGRLGLDLASIHKRFETWVAAMSAASKSKVSS